MTGLNALAQPPERVAYVVGGKYRSEAPPISITPYQEQGVSLGKALTVGAVVAVVIVGGVLAYRSMSR